MAQWAKGREKENKNRMKVTIKMVAEKCNVSPVTVSRVLANHSSVNEKTRETVLNAMQELGYRSKKVEKLMDKKESRYIAVMIEDITQSANCIIQAAANYLRGENYLPIVCETGEKAVYLETYLTNLDKDGLLAGCIVISSQGARAELAKMAEKFRALPLVAVHWCEAWSKVDSVILDNYQGTVCAIHYLAKLGHREIALINAPQEASGSYEERMGYMASMKSLGIPFEEKRIIPGNLKRDGGVAAARRILTEQPEVTAVVCSNFSMAMGVIDETTAQGRRVPEDLSVVPFGIIQSNEDTANFTSVGAHYSDAGVAAARMVLERVRELEENGTRFNIVKKVVLEPRIFYGSTTCQCQKG